MSWANVAEIPFRGELEALAGGHVIVRALQRLIDELHTPPFRIGAAALHVGQGSPEASEVGDVGDLYLRIDRGTSPATYAAGVNSNPTGLAAATTLASPNTPTLYTKARHNGAPIGWTAQVGWTHVVNRVDGETRHDDWKPHPSGLPLLGNTVVHWTGWDGADAGFQVTGIAAGYQGQLLLIRNSNTLVPQSSLTFAHQSTNSIYGNRLTNIVTSADTPILLNGYALYEYDETGWTLIAHDQGTAQTFTPTIGFGGLAVGVTYGAQQGTSLLSGREVQLYGRLTLTAKGTSVGVATLRSLPYTAHGTYYGAIAMPFYNNMAGLNDLMAYVAIGTTTAQLTSSGATVIVNVADTHFTNTSDFLFAGRYLTT